VREVFVRRVQGSFVTDGDLWCLAAPPMVFKALEATTGRGGKRVGAGRPRANQSAPTPGHFDYAEAPETTEEKIKLDDRIETLKESLVFLPSEETPAAARRLVSWEEGMDGLPVMSDDAGSLLMGGAHPAKVGEAAWVGLPPFPGFAVVQPAVIPAPPKIEFGTSSEARIEMLRDAYNTACRRALPDEFNHYATKPFAKRDRHALLDGAGQLFVEEISPLRWAEFAVDMWKSGREQDEKKRAVRPAPKWVFSATLVARHAGWARTEREHRGARVVLTRSHRTLLDRYATMLSAVLCGAVSPAEAEQKFFPDGAYARLVERATNESQREQAEIDRRVQAGEYLWS